MPPSMQKGDSTSVRDRVLAIERGQVSENSIIRARYVPDVRGVNRYKHFHVANSSAKPNGQEKPTSNHSPSDMPPLQGVRGRGTRHLPAATLADDNGVEKGRRNKKTTLPQLGPSNVLAKTQKDKDICDYIEQQAKSALASSDSLSSSTATTRSTLSGRKLHDHLSSSHRGNQRTFASLGTAKAEVDNSGGSGEESSMTRKIQTSSETASAPRTVKESKKRGTPQVFVNSVKEAATQTLIKAKKPETPQAHGGDSCGEGRSTQTDSYAIVVAPPRRRKSEAPVNMDDIEEREALYQVIEDALGETIDRYSRIRANQIIANSARKQGQIWRDAKDFIANQLVPQSIQLANKSRSRKKTAAEIVASIKCYP